MTNSGSFAIDGTGRVIRRNDRVVVRAMSWSHGSGPAIVNSISPDRDRLGVTFDDPAEDAEVYAIHVHRADDTERDPVGRPLWSVY